MEEVIERRPLPRARRKLGHAVYVRLPIELLDDVERLAADRLTERGTVIRQAVAEFVRRQVAAA